MMLLHPFHTMRESVAPLPVEQAPPREPGFGPKQK
jgi:hypothetical protein